MVSVPEVVFEMRAGGCFSNLSQVRGQIPGRASVRDSVAWIVAPDCKAKIIRLYVAA